MNPHLQPLSPLRSISSLVHVPYFDLFLRPQAFGHSCRFTSPETAYGGDRSGRIPSRFLHANHSLYYFWSHQYLVCLCSSLQKANWCLALFQLTGVFVDHWIQAPLHDGLKSLLASVFHAFRRSPLNHPIFTRSPLLCSLSCRGIIIWGAVCQTSYTDSVVGIISIHSYMMNERWLT